MKDFRDILAYAWSVVCYPLFVTTYLMVAFCIIYSTHIMPLPTSYCLLLVGGTFVFTCLIPLLMLLLMKRLGHIDNLDVTDRRQRTVPYIYTLISLAFWVAFLFQMHLPAYMLWSAVSSLLCLVLVTLITLRWKISVHLSSFGGATAMMLAIMYNCHFLSVSMVCILLFLGWLLMIARIRLNAHTPSQTVAGYLLGMLIVLLPNIILSYV